MTDTLANACMTEQAIDEYLSDYTMDGDSEFHMPTDAERFLIKDAIMGLLVDQNFLASFAPLTEPELRAGIALQLREIERLRKRVDELSDLLTSARAIAERKGDGTHWERFSERLAAAGIGSITPRTFRVLPSDTPPERMNDGI